MILPSGWRVVPLSPFKKLGPIIAEFLPVLIDGLGAVFVLVVIAIEPIKGKRSKEGRTEQTENDDYHDIQPLRE